MTDCPDGSCVPGAPGPVATVPHPWGPDGAALAAAERERLSREAEEHDRISKIAAQAAEEAVRKAQLEPAPIAAPDEPEAAPAVRRRVK